MAIVITAFEQSPDRGRGLARDMRVRWALEEVGQAYEVHLVSFEAMKQAPHLALHPFGQIPTLEDGDLVLFESGAIVLHLAERYEGLLPLEISARGRAVSWVFAALNSVEPSILELESARFFETSQPWHAERLPLVEERIKARLGRVSNALADRDWLDGDFSAGDLMMASVLIRLKSSGLLNTFPNLVEYLARCEARPAYERAFAAQLAVFLASEAGRPGSGIKSGLPPGHIGARFGALSSNQINCLGGRTFHVKAGHQSQRNPQGQGRPGHGRQPRHRRGHCRPPGHGRRQGRGFGPHRL